MENNPLQQNAVSESEGKTAGIISYFTIIGWLIAYFAMHKDKKTEIGSYQLRQTLLLNIVGIIAGWGIQFLVGVMIVSTGIFALAYLSYIVNIGLLILWIIGLIGAINGEKKPIPLIGEKAQTMFPNI
ncbi:MAG: hypothetical protein WC756_03350 [Taibaiella sp.]|jgi:uncharacterized membrane protein